MNTKRLTNRVVAIVTLIIAITAASTQLRADTGTCGGQTITVPFTDVAGSNFFCSIAEAYFSGLTNGTSSTTYSPSGNVPRDQMAAFVTRTLDQSLKRGSRRAALKQWDQGAFSNSGMTSIPLDPISVESDGEDLWIAGTSDTITRVHASDGRLIESWTGADHAHHVLVTRGRIYATGYTSPGKLYRIDPKQTSGTATLVSSNLGNGPKGIATDGDFIWTANFDDGSVSRVNPGNANVTTFTNGFSAPVGMLFDGTNIWVTDNAENKIKKMNSDGSIALSIIVGANPGYPVFDGTNIWVPNGSSDSVTVVRVKNVQGNSLAAPFVLATLTGNGLSGPIQAAFDGQRILVTNLFGDNVSLWEATSLAPLGSFDAGVATDPYGACSDGVNFWIVLRATAKLARF